MKLWTDSSYPIVLSCANCLAPWVKREVCELGYKIIDEADNIVVDRQLLLAALDRASVMMFEDTNSTKLIFDSNQLIVTATATEVAESTDIVPIKYDGSRIEIVFNPTYVMDPLKAIDEDEVTIELNDGTKPAMIKCSIPFLYVMMPLRVS